VAMGKKWAKSGNGRKMEMDAKWKSGKLAIGMAMGPKR